MATTDAFDYMSGPSAGVTSRSAFMASGRGAVSLSKGTMLGIMALKKDLFLLAKDFAKNGGLRVPLERCVEEVLIPSIKMNFAAQGRPQMWEPINELSEYRSQGHQKDMILQPTGGMMRTATAKARFHIRENVINYGNWPKGSAHEASKWGYTHDMGSKGNFGRVPARPFAIYQNSDMPKITKVFAKWAQERAGKRLRVHYGGF